MHVLFCMTLLICHLCLQCHQFESVPAYKQITSALAVYRRTGHNVQYKTTVNQNSYNQGSLIIIICHHNKIYHTFDI